MHALNLGSIVQAILFLLFADLTAFIAAVIGPTYDQLLVPELSPPALFPPLFASGAGNSNYLAPAARFSETLISEVVDPAIALVVLGIAVLYLARAVSFRWRAQFDALLPRLVLAVVAANFTVPIGGAILSVAGSLYPVISGWDGGAWQHWSNLAGFGEVRFSWDNGALAFILALVEFTLVLGLVLAVGVRDALLAVLLVALPIFTLVWPFRPLSSLARRGWLLFVELAFLPCLMVIPLELAVGATTPVLLVAYLGVALGSPYLLSLAGTHLGAIGFPSVPGAIGPTMQRATGATPIAPVRYGAPAFAATGGNSGRTLANGLRAVGTASAPMAPPIAFAELLGQGAAHLTRHVRGVSGSEARPPRIPPLRPGGGA